MKWDRKPFIYLDTAHCAHRPPVFMLRSVPCCVQTQSFVGCRRPYVVIRGRNQGGWRLSVGSGLGTREMLEWHKARVSGVTGVYTPLLRRLRHTHKKRGLVAYTVRSKVAMLKYSATCQRALEEGLMEREGGALRTTWCCGAALLYIARTCPSLKSLSHTDS
jgi:hypothetical protein